MLKAKVSITHEDAPEGMEWIAVCEHSWGRDKCFKKAIKTAKSHVPNFIRSGDPHIIGLELVPQGSWIDNFGRLQFPEDATQEQVDAARVIYSRIGVKR